MQGEFVITNTSENPLEAWNLSFDCSFEITNLWDARILNRTDDHYIIASEAWSNPIPAGGSITIGFAGIKSAETETTVGNYSLTSVVADEDEPDLPDLDTDVIDLGYIEDLIFAGLIEVIQDKDGNIRTIDGKFTNKTVNSANDAASVLNCASTLFGNKFSASDDDISVQVNGTETFYRYTPNINGVPVLGSQIILAVNNGKVTGLFSTYDNLIENVNTISQITSETAIEIALNDLFESIPEFIDALVIESGLTNDEIIDLLRDSLEINSVLAIYANPQKTPNLTWIISLKNEYEYIDDGDTESNIDFSDVYDYSKYVLSFDNNTYYVYANGNNVGHILYVSTNTEAWASTTANANDLLGVNRSFNVEHREAGFLTSEKYRMKDSYRNIETYEATFFPVTGTPQLPGSMLQSDNNTWANAASVSAHANLTEVYDFYRDALSWESFDGKGATIKSSVDFREAWWFIFGNVPLYNPYWNHSQFVFGDTGNFSAALDVVAHEYTHAVIDHMIYETWGPFTTSRGLEYKNESGALNESYADILGSLAEGKTDSDKWLIGEDSDKAIRSMADPSQYNQPVHYSNRYTGTEATAAYIAIVESLTLRHIK